MPPDVGAAGVVGNAWRGEVSDEEYAEEGEPPVVSLECCRVRTPADDHIGRGDPVKEPCSTAGSKLE